MAGLSLSLGGTESSAFDTRDRILLALRCVALAWGLIYAATGAAAAVRTPVVWAFGVFAGYSALIYVAGWGLLRTRAKQAVYAALGGCDLAFVAALMLLTGDAQSPFYRALYLWVAMLAFLFGWRAGLLSSALASAWFLGLQAYAGFPGEPWVLAVQGAGLLLHGVLIGFLVERSRRTHARLAEASRQLTEEHAHLVHAERLSSIGLLASGVAHEINNPLSGVISCLKTLERQSDLAPQRRAEYFATALDGLDRIRGAVRGLLDYARERTPTRIDVRLEDAISSSARLISPVLHERNLEIRIDVEGAATWVRADRTELMQAVMNVLLNAARASRPGGVIDVSGRREQGQVRIRVADRGAGIPSDLLDQVFEPFFTTSPGERGTGLGLSITRAIARRHGGDVELTSSPGQGTVVTISFPAKGDTLADA